MRPPSHDLLWRGKAADKWSMAKANKKLLAEKSDNSTRRVNMHVYILKSQSSADRFYVGRTSHLKRRLKEHNSGKADATYKHRPWSIVVAVWLPDESRASAFEEYLKTGSGRAFTKRHFESSQ